MNEDLLHYSTQDHNRSWEQNIHHWNTKTVVSLTIIGTVFLSRQYNDQAFEDFNTKALKACPSCARTFLPKPLEIHMRSCKPKSPQPDAAPPKPKPKARRPVAKPKPKEPEKEYSKEEIIEKIENEPALDDPEKRAQLMKFLKKLALS